MKKLYYQSPFTSLKEVKQPARHYQEYSVRPDIDYKGHPVQIVIPMDMSAHLHGIARHWSLNKSLEWFEIQEIAESGEVVFIVRISQVKSYLGLANSPQSEVLIYSETYGEIPVPAEFLTSYVHDDSAEDPTTRYDAELDAEMMDESTQRSAYQSIFAPQGSGY